MKRILVVFLLGVFLGVVGSYDVDAGWFDDAVQDAVENVGRRAVDDTADSAYEGTKDSLKKTRDTIVNSDDGDADEENGSRRRNRTEEE